MYTLYIQTDGLIVNCRNVDIYGEHAASIEVRCGPSDTSTGCNINCLSSEGCAAVIVNCVSGVDCNVWCGIYAGGNQCPSTCTNCNYVTNYTGDDTTTSASISTTSITTTGMTNDSNAGDGGDGGDSGDGNDGDSVPVVVDRTLRVTAKFSSDFTQIGINFTLLNDTDEYSSNDVLSILSDNFGDINCSDIFVNVTMKLLSSKAECEWDIISDDTYNSNVYGILVALSGYSTIMIDDSLLINENIFVNNGEYNVSFLNPFISNNDWSAYKIETINISNNSIIPQIKISNFQYEIGICDDIILDARDSYNLGGRTGQFKWIITTPNNITNRSVAATNNGNMSDSIVISRVYYGMFVRVPETDLNFLRKYIDDYNYNNEFAVTLMTNIWYYGNVSVILNGTQQILSEKNHKTTILPLISIDGTSVIDDNGGNNYNEETLFLVSNFRLLTNISCLSQELELSLGVGDNSGNSGNDTVFSYKIFWNVSESTNTIDVSEINNYLIENDKYNQDNLIIPMKIIQNLLTVDYIYNFNLYFDCEYINIGLACDSVVKTTHQVYYKRSDLVCQIVGGTYKTVSNISWSDLTSNSQTTFFLDGSTFTYDPEKIDITDKSGLTFAWDCFLTFSNTYNDNNNSNVSTISCNAIMQNPDEGINYLVFDYLGLDSAEQQQQQQMEFYFELTVKDNDTNRDCVTYQVITFYLRDRDDDNDAYVQAANTVILYDLSLTAVKTKITSTERVRLIATINNDDNPNIYQNFVFEYSELNGYLTTTQIEEYRAQQLQDIHSDLNLHNLVLSENVLTEGKSYNFNLNVYNNDESEIMATSNVIVTVVEAEANIIDGSFVIEPDCNNLTFNSIEELLDLTFYFGINVYTTGTTIEDDVTYQFSLQSQTDTSLNDILLHSSVLHESYLEDVVLPEGDYWIKVTVFDVNGVYKSSLMHSCSIHIDHSNEEQYYNNNVNDTLEYLEVSINNNDLVSLNSQINLYLQSIQVILLHYGGTDEILKFMHDYFNPNVINLCQLPYVIHVAEIVNLLMKMFQNTNSFDIMHDAEQAIAMLYDLLKQILDPCNINENVGTELSFEKQFNLDVESIVTQQRRIYTDEFVGLETEFESITSTMSALLLDEFFADYFYDIIDNSVNFFQNNDYSTKFTILAKNSLYIWNLLHMSQSIPSEIIQIDKFDNFQIYSLRVFNQTINYQTQSNNTAVDISNEDTSQGRETFAAYYQPLKSIDCMLIALNLKIDFNGTNNNITHTTLVHILSNNTNYDLNYQQILQDNVTLIHTIDWDVYLHDNVNILCVWYNESTNDSDNSVFSWSSDGCVTNLIAIDEYTGQVTCNCNHMTTFAILYYLDEQEKNDNDFFDQYSKNGYYGYILVLLIFGFIGVAVYVLRLFHILRFKYGIPITCLWITIGSIKKHKRRNMNNPYNNDKKSCEVAPVILFLTLIQSVCQFGSCLIFLLYAVVLPNIDSDNDNYTDSEEILKFFTEFLTFGLFLPLIVSFYIYTCIIYALGVVSAALGSRIEKMRRRIFKFTMIGVICITLVLLTIAACFIADITIMTLGSYWFVLFESIYLVLLCVTLILVNYFTYTAFRTVKTTLNMLKEAAERRYGNCNGDEESLSKRKKTMYKILISTMVLSFVLLVQIISMIVFMIDVSYFHPIIQMIEIFLHLLYLIFVVYFYQNYFTAKIKDKMKQSYVFIVFSIHWF